ncbi:sigma 54-interacting transcriptional regulator [Gemmatimonas sp.]|uniref:sigma 54-interacting transcriptional regulator n=1 Tax=Gemmatimonas sp. TaxID=1962908 RepID=UPI0037BF7CD9
MIGTHESVIGALERAARFAEADGPVLVTGETGTGKELFVRAIYLLSRRNRRPFIAVNCAQFHDGQLLASELFGHRKGAFTGAAADHKGVFEEASGGVVFLDEIGELAVPAQAMLLRALGEGEIVPVGSAQARRVDVRVIAATSRDLRPMMSTGRFREDLYFRLRHLHLRVPPLRERGDDWRIILQHYLHTVNAREGCAKRYSAAAMRRLAQYDWPGNVRELRSLIDTGFYMSDGVTIEAEHFIEAMEEVARTDSLCRIPILRDGGDPYSRLLEGEGTFWELVHAPYMARELSRAEVRRLLDRGLTLTRGSYKKLLPMFGLGEREYLKFMDFLRHHDLKPGG